MLCLAITGFEADPDLVSELVDLTPTSVARRGTPTRGGRTYQFNGWWLEAHEDAITGGAQHHAGIDALVAQLRSRVDRFATLRDRLSPKSVTIYGGLYVSPNAQCGLWLEPHQMRVLAACGIGWGLDLFVDASSS